VYRPNLMFFYARPLTLCFNDFSHPRDAWFVAHQIPVPRDLGSKILQFKHSFILHSLAMAPGLVHLPNGQTMAVSPIFGGLSFKANDLNIHHSIFPPGWTIILETEDGDNELEDDNLVNSHQKHHTHRYRAPTLNQDNLFISSISNPSNTDFKPATSPTRQTAMMLWATLWWYFHQVPCWAALVEL